VIFDPARWLIGNVVPPGTAETEPEADLIRSAVPGVRASHERGLRRRYRNLRGGFAVRCALRLLGRHPAVPRFSDQFLINRLGLRVECGDRTRVHGVSFLVGVSDGRHAQESILAERAHHVENDTGLS
jgi:hypothetical protein